MITLSKSETSGSRMTEGHAEGPLAALIEEHTAKLPSDVFLWGAFGSIGAALVLMLTGRQKAANFVGQWAPTILILGLYNKLVKRHGHDQQS